MVTTRNYEENALTILKNEEDALKVNEFYIKLRSKVNELKTKIIEKKYRILNGDIKLPNPFLKIFDYGEGNDEILVCIYYICKNFSFESNKNYFLIDEISYVQNKTEKYFDWYRLNLIESGYICLIERFGLGGTNKYKLTEKGVKRAEEIIKVKRLKFPDNFDELISNWKKRYERYS
jgi:hypothetical protein